MSLMDVYELPKLEREILLGLALLKKQGKSIECYETLIKPDKQELFEKLNNISERRLKEEYERETYEDIRMGFSISNSIGEIIAHIAQLEDNKRVLTIHSGNGKLDAILFNDNQKIKLTGYQFDEINIKMAQIRSDVNGYNAQYIKKDVFKEKLEESSYEVVISDAPIIQHKYMFENKDDDVFLKNCERMGIESKAIRNVSSTWTLAINLLSCLKKEGKMIIVANSSSLYSDWDEEVRKFFVDNGYVESVLCLPEMARFNLYTYIVVLNNSANCEKVKFIDLRSAYSEENRLKREIDVEKAKAIIDTPAIEVSNEEIMDNDYSLWLNEYVEKVEISNGIKLGEVTNKIARGYQATIGDRKNCKSEDEEGDVYKVLEAGSISQDGNIIDDLTIIKGDKNKLDKYLLEDGDIVILSRGAIIKKSIIKVKENERIIANGSLIIIRADKRKINPVYLKMFFDSENGVKSLRKIQTGISIQLVNMKKLEKMLVPCPSMDIQNKLVKKYEDKLEMIMHTKKLLGALNEELKEIADSI